MKKYILTAALALLALSVSSAADTAGRFPYPAYQDRAGWDSLTGTGKDELIKAGEKYLDRQWVPILASAYIEYEKTGSSALMDEAARNRVALNAMVLAELAEGKGRFVGRIADYAWLETTRFSWSLAAQSKRQASGRALPVPDDRYVTPDAAANAVSLAVAWYFFHKEFDRLDPSISKMILRSMRTNVFEPFLDDSKARVLDAGCDFGVLVAFLLADDDRDELVRAEKRSSVSLDAVRKRMSAMDISSLIEVLRPW